MSEQNIRRRDADRSRTLLLEAAEARFSAHGFDGVSLQDIAADASLSRGTPSYFFGNKEGLYAAVLATVFDARDTATRSAFAPLASWAAHGGDDATLHRALRTALTKYLGFLLARPSFVRLVSWEDLSGGHRLRDTRPTASTLMSDTFVSVRRRLKTRFAPDDAVLLFVALTFSLRANHDTFLAAMGHDLTDPRTRRHHVALATEQLHHLITK